MFDDVSALSRMFLKIHDREFRRAPWSGRPLSGRFSIVVGPRGVGKTTTLVQHLLSRVDGDRSSHRILYLPTDHVLIGNASLYDIASEFVASGGETVCFDEIHKYPDWSRELKSVSDTFPKLVILASGSSALEIGKGSHDLSRRAVVLKMPGLSFREFVALRTGVVFDPVPLTALLSRHVAISANIVAGIESAKAKVLPLFRDFLRFGHYPYFLEQTDPDLFRVTLAQGVQATLEADLPAVHPALTGSGIRKIARLLSVIAEMVPFTPEMRRLRNLLDIGDERTLKSYLGYLEDAGLIRCVHRAGKSFRSMEKPERIHLGNPNLCHALAGVRGPEPGTVRESFFLAMVGVGHRVEIPERDDFLVDGKTTVEVGGKTKSDSQVKGIPSAFLALDGLEEGVGRRIPLWLFGFLY